MALVETRIVRKFRFEMPDNLVKYLMCEFNELPAPGTAPAADAAWKMAIEAFNRWSASEDAAIPFCFDETADCVLGSEILRGFEIVPESERYDGTPIV